MHRAPVADPPCSPPWPERLPRAVADPGRARPLAAVRACLVGGPGVAPIAPEATLEAPGLAGQLRGAVAIAGYWSALLGALDGRELTTESAFEAGDRAAIVVRLRGVHRGRLLGRAPTGRRIDLPLVVLARVDGGQIRHLRFSFDRRTLLEQIGEG